MWCYDRGDDCDQEHRYTGPFKTKREAADNDGELWQDSGWADWENEFARLRPGAVEAFERWLDEFVEVDIYICEGDEP